MKRRTLMWLVAIPALVVSGCAQSPELVARAYVPPPTSESLATVFLFRANAVPTRLNARLFVDEAQVATLPDMAHTWIQVSAGQHKLEVKFPMLAVTREVVLRETFEAGKTYYLRYEGTAPRGGTALVGPGGVYMGNVGGSGAYSNTLKVVSADQAQAVIKDLRLTYFPAQGNGE